MKNWLLIGVVAMFTMSVIAVEDADARRFGGGSSFGKQRMQAPANNFSQRKAAPQKSTATANQRGSARTGMMGMLGGLALGGLLGAMFFGGAFEGINFMDIVVIGGLIALLIWFLRKKAASQSMAYAGARNTASDTNQDFAQPVHTASIKMLRPVINEKHFLTAARDIFMRMQTAWDAKDMNDIRKFCTPEIADQIEQDLTAEGVNLTEVVTLNAELADSWIESDLEWAAVNFSAMMREKTTGNQTVADSDTGGEIHETWIFQHDANSDDPTWFLAGIQQQA